MLEFFAQLPKVIIIVGGFGSGKSEFAINLALGLSRLSKFRVALADFDIVNPYFRTREAHEFLQSKGIQPLVPPGELRWADLPVVPGVQDMIRDPKWQVVLDVGGDDMGASVLGTIAESIMTTDYSMMMVVNPYRPFTSTIDEIVNMGSAIQEASRLQLTGLISNPNLGMNTTPEVLTSGHHLISEVAAVMNLPVLAVLVLKRLMESWNQKPTGLKVPLLPLDLYLFPEWLQQEQLRFGNYLSR